VAKKKAGEKYECEECGLVVVVEDVCGCDDCKIVCCEEPMKKVKAPVKKAAKVVAKPKAKAAPPKKKAKPKK
jgi:hypothetical protein